VHILRTGLPLPGDVPRAARRQAGVFTRDQALAGGWTARQVEHRLGRGQWRRLAGRGLVATAALEPGNARQLAWAAALTYPDAVIGLRTAAALHGMPVRATSVDIYSATRHRGTWTAQASLRVHRSTLVRGVRRLDGIAVTDRETTGIDCLATLPWEEALDLYAWLISGGHLDHAGLCRSIGPRLARPGTAQLRRLASVTRDGAVSVGEMRLHRVLRGGGITGWRANVVVRDAAGPIGVVDVLVEAARLVIEVDGMRAHSGKEAFLRDRRRQNRLINAGFRVLRFTWWDLTECPDTVLAQIHEALKAS